MKLSPPLVSFFFTASLLLASVQMTAAEIDVTKWVKEAELAAYYAGDDGKTLARMMIVDSQGRKLLRQFTILRKDISDNGDQRMMVFFSRPNDVKNTVFRVEKHAAVNQDDDRWIYLPALDLVKRISAGDKRTSFVGSHFFYEDVSGRAVSEDSFTFENETSTHIVLRAVPKHPDSVEFSHYLVSINKQTKLPELINFYDAQNNNYRRVESAEVNTIQGFPTVMRLKVSDLKNGGYTLMEFKNPEYNVGLPDEIFSERSLRTPPLTYLN